MGSDPPWERAILGKRSSPLQSIETLCRKPYKNGWTDRDAVWVVDSVDTRKNMSHGGPDPPWEWKNLTKGPLQSIVTVCRQLCMNGWPDRDTPFGMVSRVDSMNHALDGGSDFHGRGNFERGQGMPRHLRRHSAVSCANTAEPIDW